MRIDKKEQLAGCFWQVADPHIKLAGTLSIEDGGVIELQTFGSFYRGSNTSMTLDDFRLGRLHGYVEELGAVTLDNCICRNFNVQHKINAAPVSKSSIAVLSLVSGFLFEKDQNVLVNSFSFQVECLDEWLNLSGVVEHEYDSQKADIKYRKPKDVSIELNNGIRMVISYGFNVLGAPFLTGASINQYARLSLISNNLISVNDIRDLALKIVHFFCFCIDETVSLKNVVLENDNIKMKLSDKIVIPIEMKYFYPSVSIPEKVPRISNSEMLFVYPQVEDMFPGMLQSWLNAYEVIEPAMNLYFSSRTGAHRYLNGKFLALAQCLETLHRLSSSETLMCESDYKKVVEGLLASCEKDRVDWLRGRLAHGNELNLRKRLKQLFVDFNDEFGGQKNVSSMLNCIVDTRNYFTHYSPELKDKAAQGHSLFVLCRKMEALFQIQLLKRIGLSKSVISKMCKNNHQLHNKLTFS